MTPLYVLKANGDREPFDEQKLRNSLIRAGASEQNAEIISTEVMGELADETKTLDIYKKAFEHLHKLSLPAAKRYVLKRAVMDLGPSGFPFEKYVAEILRRKGFEVKTDEMMLGECVEHEVDVVAWNDKDLLAIEAKFHNELGIKSDLKVVLYVKARIDDLKGTTFDYGGKNRKVTEGWLVTNTKFTTTAIHYAECTNLKLLGWNYPEKENLHDLIIETKTLPITCLGLLDQQQKRTLLKEGIVFCDSLLEKPEILKTIGFNDERAEHILHEIKEL
ncbi:MAG: restriction endonuclease [Minisyncoccia bacterium]